MSRTGACHRSQSGKFDHESTDWMLDLLGVPAKNLTHSNQSYLESDDFVVGPKADGEHMLLLCESSTNDLYLIPMRAPPYKLPGTYKGPPRTSGFLMDVEVINMGKCSRLVLAFDILATQYPHKVKGEKVRTSKKKEYVDEGSILDRHEIMKLLIEGITTPGVFVKPIAPAREAVQKWKDWENLPYRIDGLIFTPILKSFLPALKWKPVSELTLDVALGGPLECKDGYTSFLAHLRGSTMVLPPVKTKAELSKLVPQNHHQCCYNRHCHLFHKVSSDLRRTPYDEKTDDITQTHLDDLEKIRLHRDEEAKVWRASKSCNSFLCPCKEIFPGRATEIGHCTKCGALGVGDLGSRFSCLISCFQDSPNISTRCVVWVPNQFAPWARHSIVEVDMPLGIPPSQCLRFRRLRQDKYVANSFAAAQELAALYQNPVDLSQVKFKEVTQEPARTPYRLTGVNLGDKQSGFSKMRAFHYAIKGWLYQVFGGESILDICSGSLNDVHNWLSANISNVVAVERDSELFLKGRKVVQELHSKSSCLNVDFVQGDLNEYIDLEDRTVIAKGQVDAVFCFFAIHYLWDSGGEKTRALFQNTADYLKEGGRFVVTFLQGEILEKMGHVLILGEEGTVEFEATVVDDQKQDVKVYVKSIGVPHVEKIMYIKDMESCFSEFGFSLTKFFPFETFLHFFPANELTPEEKHLSSLYGAAVFEKRSSSIETNKALIHPCLPTAIEKNVIGFLALQDIVACRSLSKSWFNAVENLDIPEDTTNKYFTGTCKIIFDKSAETYKINGDSDNDEISARAVALYLRMGGPRVPEFTPPYDRYDARYDARYDIPSDGSW